MGKGTTVVRVLVAVLMIVGIALLNLTWYFQREGSCVIWKVPTDVMTLQFAAEQFALAHEGCWPASMEELVQSRHYRGEPPLDLWHRPYLLEPSLTPGSPPRIFTLGRDGMPGGLGDDADFDNSGRIRYCSCDDEPDGS
jgi:hypothetical protein